MKILITGGNNAKTLKLLKAFPDHFILLADYGDVPGILTAHYGFSSLGILNKDSIAHILLNFCITESVDSIIPLHDYEVEPIAKSAVLFGEYGIQVLLPSSDKLSDYIETEKSSFSDLVIFIKGVPVFSTHDIAPGAQSPELSGAFGYNPGDENFKLFMI